MKKIFILIIMMLIVLPMTINADMIPVSVRSYSNEITVGSTVNYVVLGATYDYADGSNLNGKFIYDTNYLEYLNISCVDPLYTEGEIILPEIKIINHKDGVLEYKVNNEAGIEGAYEVTISFKVKAVPSEGPLRVKFYPVSSDVLYGAEYVAIGANVIGNKKTEDTNEFYYPEDENEQSTEDENEQSTEDENEQSTEGKINKTVCKENKTNIVLLVSLIISIVVNVILAILLFIKTRKKEKSKN